MNLQKYIEAGADKYCDETTDDYLCHHVPHHQCQNCNGKEEAYKAGASLLLPVVERMKAALEFYAKDQQFSDGTTMNNSQKRDMDDYGSTAREALAELDKLGEM